MVNSVETRQFSFLFGGLICIIRPIIGPERRNSSSLPLKRAETVWSMKDKYFELLKWEMFQQNFHKESDVAEKESGSIVGNGRLIFRVSCFFSSPDGCHFEHFEVIRWKWRGTEMSIILILFLFFGPLKTVYLSVSFFHLPVTPSWTGRQWIFEKIELHFYQLHFHLKSSWQLIH